MTRSAEQTAATRYETAGFGARWRSERERRQEQVMPQGSVVVSCAAPLGVGGLGHHLREITEALGRAGQPCVCICGSTLQATPLRRRPTPMLALARGIAPLTRFSPAWRIWTGRVSFDAQAACRLPGGDHLIAFNRQALEQIKIARANGYQTVSLMSGSPHVRRVARQHALACSRYPLERSFGTHIVQRYLTEYELADRICLASRYSWESFVEQGIPQERLALFPLIPDPRYKPASEPRSSSSFDVVYVGSLTVPKGVPLLVDALRRLPYRDLRLILVGGWKSRGMRRFLERASAQDARLLIRPGDSLPWLQGARLCAHPTYEDGFAYAPAEALACGVPVLVSEDTGMRELIEPGRTGLVLPTGDLDALTESMQAVYRGEILSD